MGSLIGSIQGRVAEEDFIVEPIEDAKALACRLLEQSSGTFSELEIWFLQAVAKKGLFGANLSVRMDNRGMTPSDLAAQVGVSLTAVNNWLEKGRMPSGKNLIAIARVLSCSIDDLTT